MKFKLKPSISMKGLLISPTLSFQPTQLQHLPATVNWYREGNRHEGRSRLKDGRRPRRKLLKSARNTNKHGFYCTQTLRPGVWFFKLYGKKHVAMLLMCQSLAGTLGGFIALQNKRFTHSHRLQAPNSLSTCLTKILFNGLQGPDYSTLIIEFPLQEKSDAAVKFDHWDHFLIRFLYSVLLLRFM